MTSVQRTIGTRLKKLRQKKKITQQELSRNICSQAEISKIENGKNSPTIELLQDVAKKLRVPVSFFFMDEEEIEEFHQIDHQITQLMRAQKHAEILKIIPQKLKNTTAEGTRILLRYYQLINEVEMKKIDYRTCISQLLKLVNDKLILEEYFLIYVRIQMAVAVLYTNNKEYMHAHNIYKETLKLDYVTDDYKKLMLKVKYNYIRNLIKLKKFSLVIAESTDGINESNKMQDMSYLGHFFYQQGYALEQLCASSEKIKEAYTQAYVVFIATENKAYKEILDEYLFELMYFTID